MEYKLKPFLSILVSLTRCGRVIHMCVSDLTIIDSDNGMSPSRRQAIIWTNTGILLIPPLGTNFSEIVIAIHIFSFKKMHLKMASAKWRPFCRGFNVLTHTVNQYVTSPDWLFWVNWSDQWKHIWWIRHCQKNEKFWVCCHSLSLLMA